MSGVIARLRRSLDLDTVFQTTVTEVRELLNADRTGVFRFLPDTEWSDGEFISEDVRPGWDSVLALRVHDHCFGSQFAFHYQQGRIQAVADILMPGLAIVTLKF